MEPRIVTPQEAQQAESVLFYGETYLNSADLLHTVATEPERIREAVVLALRNIMEQMYYEPDSSIINTYANLIEAGAPY